MLRFQIIFKIKTKGKHLKMTTISLVYEVCAVVMSFPNITIVNIVDKDKA